MHLDSSQSTSESYNLIRVKYGFFPNTAPFPPPPLLLPFMLHTHTRMLKFKYYFYTDVFSITLEKKEIAHLCRHLYLPVNYPCQRFHFSVWIQVALT